MGSSPDDFAGLRALLKVKRHEQPPPRYFDDLSHGIFNRLRGPDGLRRSSLLSLLGFDFGMRQALFYGLGVSCCTLALYATLSALTQRPAVKEPPTASAVFLRSPQGLPPFSTSHLLNAPASLEDSVSTNPILSPGNLSFPVDGFRIRVTPVKYEPPR